MKGAVYPKRQFDGSPLKTKWSAKPVPIPQELTFALAESVRLWPGAYVVTDGYGSGAGPDRLSAAVREARTALKLPAGLNYHALRHHYASMLIHEGATVLEVCAAMRHRKPSITLDTYSHLFPTAEETVRRATARGFARGSAPPLRTLGEGGAG
jgi:integrase